MKYVGSKGRHAKQILPIILAGRKDGQAYVEPFVGGANTLQHVTGRRIAGDVHLYLIAMWKAVSAGWNCPHSSRMTEAAYNSYKSMRNFPVTDLSLDNMAAECGFIGFAMSYGGKWFGGYRRDPSGKRDYAAEAIRSAEKEFPKLRGVEFHHCSYDALPIPPNSIIYCDPPYANSQGYSTGSFDTESFWQWVRDMSAQGHTVFVSEYEAPEDFVCVWERAVNNTLAKDTGSKKAVERLFRHESQNGR
jgi:DNA adenine methylase